MGGGKLGNKGFAISGMIYPILILTLFLVVQILTTLQTRKMILDKNNQQLLADINEENEVYTLEELTKIVKEMNKKFYPVGSIYVSVSSENPEKIYGGKWERFGTGKTLVGVDGNDTNFNTVEKTGGSNKNSVILKTENLPSHSHNIPALSGTTNTSGFHNHRLVHNKSNSGSTYGVGLFIGTASTTSDPYIEGSGNHTHTVTTKASKTSNVGESKAISINNLQPYITVYMWKRVSL